MCAAVKSGCPPPLPDPETEKTMAFNKNSNGYTFLFAISMVVLVGSILAYMSLSLKPLQKANEAEKKMMNILGAIGVPSERGAVKPEFAKYVTERVSIDSEGRRVNSMSGDVNPLDKSDPFNIDVQKDFRSKAPASELNFPLFVCEKDGQDLYVVPVVGKGLWGPIWGFVALESDMETIYGAVFDHKTETPGLGAEIKDIPFQEKFNREDDVKKIKGVTPHFAVVKSGLPTDEYSVDGITGGTITSKGVGEMVDRTMGIYLKYFQSAPKAQK
jgi:Na+-transporting NADH:ubiquinone oxidoreductase subunit C